MKTALDLDSVDIAQLRAVGSVKWTRFPNTIGAFIAEMDFGTAPEIQDSLHAAIDKSLLGYLPSALSEDMSSATAQYYAENYGWNLHPEQIHPIADVIKALEVTIEHYTRPGSAVIVPTPAYMPFLAVPPTHDRKVIEVPMAMRDERAEFDLDALDRAFKAGGNLLILCNPYNPLGRVFTKEELIAVSEVVARNGGRVFSDEIHAPLVYPGNTHVPYASLSIVAASHTVTATSASKAWNLPGLKCAQIIISNDADAAHWEDFGFMASHGASNLGVIANTVAYTAGKPWLNGVITYNDENRHALADLLTEHIPGIRYTPPQGTYIAWLDCRELGLGDHPADFFRERAGVALTDGVACGANGAGFVRFIFATPRPILEQAIQQMAEALKQR